MKDFARSPNEILCAGLRSVARLTGWTTLGVLLVFRPLAAALRIVSAALLAATIFLRLVGPESFPFGLMLVISASVFAVAALYEMLCAALDALLTHRP